MSMSCSFLHWCSFVSGNADQYRQRGMASTACVLPGGQIRLAGAFGSANASSNSPVSYHGVTEKRPSRKRPLSSSWHGNTRDMIDFVLDDYVVISPDSIEKMTMSDMESMSTTESLQQGSCDSYSYASSDDGIEVDITERLKEYNIIAMPEGLHWDRHQFSLYE